MIEQLLLEWQQQIESLHFGHVVAGYFSVQVFGGVLNAYFSASNTKFLDGVVRIFLRGTITGICETTPRASVRKSLLEINKRAYITENSTYE